MAGRPASVGDGTAVTRHLAAFLGKQIDAMVAGRWLFADDAARLKAEAVEQARREDGSARRNRPHGRHEDHHH